MIKMSLPVLKGNISTPFTQDQLCPPIPLEHSGQGICGHPNMAGFLPLRVTRSVYLYAAASMRILQQRPLVRTPVPQQTEGQYQSALRGHHNSLSSGSQRPRLPQRQGFDSRPTVSMTLTGGQGTSQLRCYAPVRPLPRLP